MTILLDTHPIPEKGKVELKVDRSFEIKVTAEEARPKVNHWLLNQVSYMMGAEPPTLVVGEQEVVWRVPTYFSSPDVGRVGFVGISARDDHLCPLVRKRFGRLKTDAAVATGNDDGSAVLLGQIT